MCSHGCWRLAFLTVNRLVVNPSTAPHILHTHINSTYRGGRYLGYIVKPRYSDVTIPVSSKILGNDIIAIS